MEGVGLFVVEDMEAAAANAAVVRFHYAQHQGNGTSRVESVAASLEDLQACLGSVGVVSAYRALRTGDMGFKHGDGIVHHPAEIGSIGHNPLLLFFVN